MNDKWSVGLALNATYGIYDAQTAINNRLDNIGDGQVALKDSKWGFGGNLGLMYEMDKKTRFGLTYNSAVALNFGGTPTYTNLGPVLEQRLRAAGLYDRQVDNSVSVPQQVMLGFTRAMDSRWTLLGDVGWQNWSNFKFKQVTIESTNPTTLSKEMHGQDTWHAALGAKYKASPKWTISFGAGYDTSAFDDANQPQFSTYGSTWRLGVGATTALNSTSALNFSYEAMLTGTLSVDQQGGDLNGRLQGTYAQGLINFFTVSYQRKF
jgi:long-chain fatty acid transport protein